MVYPAAGDIMRASSMRVGDAVLDSSLYRREMVGGYEEACYLVGILNAPSLRLAFAHGRNSSRCFHKTPWEKVPIPSWNKDNPVHNDIVQTARIAEETARKMESELPNAPVSASNLIRVQLGKDEILGKLDDLVREILPDHVSD